MIAAAEAGRAPPDEPDDGTAPENLTYQKVIDLAQQIRTPVAP